MRKNCHRNSLQPTLCTQCSGALPLGTCGTEELSKSSCFEEQRPLGKGCPRGSQQEALRQPKVAQGQTVDVAGLPSLQGVPHKKIEQKDRGYRRKVKKTCKSPGTLPIEKDLGRKLKRRKVKATKEKEREQSSVQKLLRGQGVISAHSAASVQGQTKSYQPKLRDTVTKEKGDQQQNFVEDKQRPAPLDIYIHVAKMKASPKVADGCSPLPSKKEQRQGNNSMTFGTFLIFTRTTRFNPKQAATSMRRGDIQRALKVSAEHTLSGAVLMTLQHVLLLGHPDVSSRTHSLCSLPAYRLDPNRAGSSFGFTVEHCDSSTGHDTNPCGCDKDRCSDLLQGCWQKPE
ncbi:hypothetical protein Anapl_08802 [Anas platyrhynchos]|uniref:Uncharacterized protein n=1 Tax=Anas platyrhynchos TaxID=8839 RepID=R0JM76_ANAPL|nr:hypothetical protein Anapl_08802 [Anas platyrhynchos]